MLLFGNDAGMIREQADGLIRWAAGSLDDPFRVTDLEREEAGRLADEAASPPLTGGRRAVRLRDATDTATTAAKAALAGAGDALMVIEAPGLPSRSKLRALAEAAPDAAAIGVYVATGETLAASLRTLLSEAGVDAEADAVTALAEHLGGDRGLLRQEVDKLAILAGPGGRLDHATVLVGMTGGGHLSSEDAVHAAFSGDVVETDRACEAALAGGDSPISLLRAALGHAHRLALAIASGGPDGALSALRPPPHFSRRAAVTQSVRLGLDGLRFAAATLAAAERACKRTDAPVEAITRQALLGIAKRAAERRDRFIGSADG